VEYDPIEGRFWITIIDVEHVAHRFHVAVSRNDSPSTFDLVNGSAGDWYVYTGDGTGGAHGAAFNLASTLIEPEDLRFNGIHSGWLGWAYADIQPDPVHCGLVTVGTLVAPCNECTPSGTSDTRAIWVTEIAVLCDNDAEMNGDGVVDETDLLVYLDHYAKGTPQADMDGDSAVDSLDYLKYSDEYVKR